MGRIAPNKLPEDFGMTLKAKRPHTPSFMDDVEICRAMYLRLAHGCILSVSAHILPCVKLFWMAKIVGTSVISCHWPNAFVSVGSKIWWQLIFQLG